MAMIIAGGAALSFTPDGFAFARGSLLVAGACVFWAIDNNLTRKVAANDARVIACVKGLAAGLANLGAAAILGIDWPSPQALSAAGMVGFLGYGVSLALFVLALRHLGAARTGAYFSLAPFFGAILALSITRETVTLQLLAAAALMGAGVWLHITEHHAHEHTHEAMTHTHAHAHDIHHQHAHEPGQDTAEPHTHAHTHDVLVHTHPHYPDIHHQHRH
jgi:drug/metabolite transporter (DMT)-like permease